MSVQESYSFISNSLIPARKNHIPLSGLPLCSGLAKKRNVIFFRGVNHLIEMAFLNRKSLHDTMKRDKLIGNDSFIASNRADSCYICQCIFFSLMNLDTSRVIIS